MWVRCGGEIDRKTAQSGFKQTALIHTAAAEAWLSLGGTELGIYIGARGRWEGAMQSSCELEGSADYVLSPEKTRKTHTPMTMEYIIREGNEWGLKKEEGAAWRQCQDLSCVMEKSDRWVQEQRGKEEFAGNLQM